jgi:hypothetical protein
VRQQLPEGTGYGREGLTVPEAGRTVYPGDEFDAPHLVPGCVSLEPPEPEEATDGDGEGDSTGEAPATPGTPAGDGPPGAAPDETPTQTSRAAARRPRRDSE